MEENRRVKEVYKIEYKNIILNKSNKENFLRNSNKQIIRENKGIGREGTTILYLFARKVPFF